MLTSKPTLMLLQNFLELAHSQSREGLRGYCLPIQEYPFPASLTEGDVFSISDQRDKSQPKPVIIKPA